MTMQPDDWKLTAYALGELEGEERAAVEAAVNESAEFEAIVDDIRQTADVLSRELAADAAASRDGRCSSSQASQASSRSATRRSETISALSRAARTSAGCQWQWHSTRLPSAGSTSTVSEMPLKPKGRRGRKLPTMVCRWALANPRRGSKAVSHVWSAAGIALEGASF